MRSGQLCKRATPAWFESFPEPVFIMTPDGTILDANEVFAARFQSTPQECIGADVYRLLAPEIAFERKKWQRRQFVRPGKCRGKTNGAVES